jgi:hypothetical protein
LLTFKSQVRFDVFGDGRPRVDSKFFPLGLYAPISILTPPPVAEALRVDARGVEVGGFALDYSPPQIRGALDGDVLSLRFAQSGREMEYVPRTLHALVPVFPNFATRFASVVEGGVNGLDLAGAALGLSSYDLGALGFWRWALISALTLYDADGKGYPPNGRCSLRRSAQVELCGLPLPGTDFWLGSAYVFYEVGGGGGGVDVGGVWSTRSTTRSRRLRKSSLRGKAKNRWESASSRRSSSTRALASVCRRHGAMAPHTSAVLCEAPSDAFAVLAHEGSTTIHTTVLGDCVVQVTKDGVTKELSSHSTSLLEIKM